MSNQEIKNEADKIGRPSKNELYAEEQKHTLKKLLEIVGITDTNKIVYFDDINKNNDKINKILELKEDARKFFVCGNWTIFSKKNIENPHIALIKSILKTMNVKTNYVSLKDPSTQKVTKRGLIFQ